MTQTVRSNFQEEIVKLQSLVLELAYKVEENGELLHDFLHNKTSFDEVAKKIKDKDKEINAARWQVHDFGDELIVLQAPVASDFRQIMVSVQITDNLERIGDHFKRSAKLYEKSELSEDEIPSEIQEMAKLGLKMLKESIRAYRDLFEGKTNDIQSLDDEVDKLYKQAIKKTISMIKSSPEEKVDSLSKLFFIARGFERAADHAAKIGSLVNFAITGKRK